MAHGDDDDIREVASKYLHKMAEELPMWKLALGNELMRGIDSIDSMESVLSQCEDEKDKSSVYLVYGLALLEKGKYNEATPLLALQDAISFEEICLEFMRRGATEGLVLYLRAKIERLDESEKIQKAMLSSWLLEIQLSATMGEEISSYEHKFSAKIPDDENDPIIKKLKQRTLVNKGLIQAEDDGRINIFSLKDKPVSQRWRQVTKNGTEQIDVSVLLPALTYRYRDIPDNDNDLREIIPILYDEASDPAIRRFALLLAAEMDHSISITETINFRQDWLSREDLNIALRVAYRRDDKQALVVLYNLFHMHEEAVQIALSIDPSGNFAKQYLSSSSIDSIKPKLGKQLSLLVAERIISFTTGASSAQGLPDASSILEDFPLLSIQDILPLFPNFVIIDSFKHEITNSLDEYNKNIDNLKAEIEDYVKSLESIQAEMRSVRSREFFTPANSTCALSGLPLAGNGPFCIFSSGLTYLDSVFKQLQQRHLNQEDSPSRQVSNTPNEDNDDKEKEQLHNNLSQNDDTTDFLLKRRPPTFYDECPLTGQTDD